MVVNGRSASAAFPVLVMRTVKVTAWLTVTMPSAAAPALSNIRLSANAGAVATSSSSRLVTLTSSAGMPS